MYLPSMTRIPAKRKGLQKVWVSVVLSGNAPISSRTFRKTCLPERPCSSPSFLNGTPSMWGIQSGPICLRCDRENERSQTLQKYLLELPCLPFLMVLFPWHRGQTRFHFFLHNRPFF